MDLQKDIQRLQEEIKDLEEDLFNVTNTFTKEVLECQISGRKSDINFIEREIELINKYQIGGQFQGKCTRKICSDTYEILLPNDIKTVLIDTDKILQKGEVVTVEITYNDGIKIEAKLIN